jgi:hypothetical protein
LQGSNLMAQREDLSRSAARLRNEADTATIRIVI